MMNLETKFDSEYRGRQRAAIVVADHGMSDEKGRTIGGLATVTMIAPAGESAPAFIVMLYATRAGEAYGASPTKASAREATLELAQCAAEDALIKQCKRYAKKYGQLQAVTK